MRLRHLLLLFGLIVPQADTAEAPKFADDLVRWAPAPVAPVFRGTGEETWDKKIRERGWILFEDGKFHLWYTGYNDDRSKSRFLGHATSTDGTHWTRDPANPIVGQGWVEDVCVVHQGGTYFMFAEGKDDVAHLLTSADGTHWTEQGPLDVHTTDGKPIPPGPYGTPTALLDGKTWYLFYERGDRGVWLAKSDDMKVWTNVSDDPVMAMGPASYDSTAIAVDQVIRRDGMYYAYYHANSHMPWKPDWTTCVARSKDLVHWEKYAGNPILKNNCSSAMLVSSPQGDWLYTMHPEVRRFVPAPGASQGP